MRSGLGSKASTTAGAARGGGEKPAATWRIQIGHKAAGQSLLKARAVTRSSGPCICCDAGRIGDMYLP